MGHIRSAQRRRDGPCKHRGSVPHGRGLPADASGEDQESNAANGTIATPPVGAGDWGGFVMAMRRTLACLLVVGLVVCYERQADTQAPKSLDIYYVDVEGGGATLFVSPSGQSMLVDTGHPGSVDAERIMVAAKIAGLKQIDYLVTSHFHLDHVGGVPELAARIPIKNFVDHGLPTATELKDNESLYQAYLKVREKGRHMPVKPGDTIPIADLDVRVVSSGGKVITRPLDGAGAPNPLCADFVAKEELPMLAGENGRSVGVVVKYGKFRTIDL